ncbi:MAG: protein-L-isoaspartate(D-aspartate) O-methyltransferase [Bacteroidetes bacterium]|nr:protein-L-isoaspartate(D-aspartate) O-methyltransferase [Bacteroidota bacterium]
MTMKNMPEDNFKHQGMRKKLIETIRAKGIDDEPVLEAMMRVPRHFFLDKAFLNQAYDDQAFKIGAGQTISQPYTVAYQTSLLGIKKGEKVLEIGTGSGYQTSVLLELGAKVFTIERQKELFDKAKKFLPGIGYAPKMFYGDGYKGLPSFAPFDKILVTCGAPFIPADLVTQLKVGGIIVIPVGAGEIQTMTTILKTSETGIEKHELKNFRFVPMLEDKAWGK